MSKVSAVKARRELPFAEWQPQVLCLCDTMGRYKRPSFLLLQNNSERKEKRWCMMGRRGILEKKRGSGFWNRPGTDVQGRRIRLRVLVTFTRLQSPSVVAFCGSEQPRDGKLPAGVPTVLNMRPTMAEQPPSKPHQPTSPSSPSATPHTEDVIGELMSPHLTSSSVAACVRNTVRTTWSHTSWKATLWGPHQDPAPTR